MHLVKTAVGARSVSDIERRQEKLRVRDPNLGDVVLRVSRRRIGRSSEILGAGGALYWVVKREVRARQTVLSLDMATDTDGQALQLIFLDPTILPTQPCDHPGFRGWRYLPPERAPADLDDATADMPDELIRHLRDIGVL